MTPPQKTTVTLKCGRSKCGGPFNHPLRVVTVPVSQADLQSDVVPVLPPQVAGRRRSVTGVVLTVVLITRAAVALAKLVILVDPVSPIGVILTGCRRALHHQDRQ